jgi:hypothetical protein
MKKDEVKKCPIVRIIVERDYQATKWCYTYRYQIYLDGMYKSSGYSRFRLLAIRYAWQDALSVRKRLVYEKEFELK